MKGFTLASIFMLTFIIVNGQQELEALYQKKEYYSQMLDANQDSLLIKIYHDSIEQISHQITLLKRTRIIESGKKVFTKTGGPVKAEPDPFSRTIGRLMDNSSLNVLGYDGEYFKIVYKDKYLGYVNDVWLSGQEVSIFKEAVMDSIQKANDARIRAQEQKKREEYQKRQQERKQTMLAKYGKTNGTKVFEGKIWIGMTKEMLKDSWGCLLKLTERLQPIMSMSNGFTVQDKYVYVDNGIVTAWQD